MTEHHCCECVERLREGPSRVERNLDDLDRAEADRDIWRERWQQLMRDHEEAVTERDRLAAVVARVEALDADAVAIDPETQDYAPAVLVADLYAALKGDS